MTFLPATQGSMLEVIFEEFSLESGYDFLDIYDGTSTNAPHLGQYSGNDSPGTITATNNEGALTFHFSSDYGVNEPGWKATVHCVGTYEPIELVVSANPTVVIMGESSQLSVVATGGSGSYTYLWEPADPQNNGSISNPAIANPVVTPTVLPESIYNVTVTDTEGNTASGEITIEVKPMSTPEDDNAPYIYPNPNNGSFNIHFNGEVSYQIFNSIGQKVLSGSFIDETHIKSENLSKGIYLLQLNSESGCRVEKLIIEK